MSETEPETRPQHASPDALPRHTTPTWEVELLISGVAVFAMLQLPGWLDDRMLAMMPRFDAGWNAPLEAIFSYAKAAAVILAGTFTLHLLLRAHWIARVGMHSVYPGGVRWDKLRLGAVQREAEQGLHGDAATAIERADNRATIIFAIGVMLATNLLVLCLLVVGMFALAMAVLWLVGTSIRADVVFFACMMLVILPLMIFNMMDRWFGTRLRHGSALRRMLASGFRLYSRIGMDNGSNVLGLLASNEGRTRTHIVTATVMTLCIAGTMFLSSSLHKEIRLGSYALFPRFESTATRGIDAAHYDDQRDPLRDPPTPYVQSAVIKGPYLKLMVPYRPDRDIAAQQRHCPEATAIEDDDARATALLRCLGDLHAVTLDGKPLAGLHYDAASDPRTARPALLAMIDVRALAAGRHELRVAHPARREPALDFGPVEVFDRETGPADGQAVGQQKAGGNADYDSIAFWR